MIKKEQKVNIYDWEGLNREGRPVTGEIQATSLLLAKTDLSRQGVVLKKIKKRTTSFFSFKKKIKSADITLFTRQLATMLQAGIPLLHTFDIIAKSQTNLSMILLVNDLKRHVETGLTFSEALKKHPILFNELYSNLVQAGESSGSLEKMLFNIASYREKTENIIRKIKKALLYPTIVLVVGLIVSAVLLIFVIPQFQTLFKGFGAELPAFTLLVIYISEIVQAYWYLLLGGIFATLGLARYFYVRSEKFKHIVDRISLKIPVIGEILKKAAIARFSRTLSITFAAGLPLFEALKLVEGATGNILFSDATQRIREEVSSGQLLQVAMTHTNLFPNLAIQMVAIGEEAGTLETMLYKVAEYYENEVDTLVENLSTLIEPVMICVLGVLVGGLVVAMYLPIFKLGSVI